jgi:hypothetical protein
MKRKIYEPVREFERQTSQKAKANVITTEVTRRRTEARRLRASAGADWSAAKARFDQEFLGNP